MDFIPLLPTTDRPRRISPTDISQFVRLDQCERYLRLRLHERSANRGFMSDYGVAPQAIPPLLTSIGAEFEQAIEAQVSRIATASVQVIHCKRAAAVDPRYAVDVQNEVVVEAARQLPNGARLFLFQPRLQVDVGDWRIRGDIDVLRLERDTHGNLSVLIADMKSSRRARIEHRLQTAFYQRMLDTLFTAEQIAAEITTGVLYRGPAAGTPAADEEEQALHDEQREAAREWFAVDDALLEIVEDAEHYLAEVDALVTGDESLADRIACAEFESLSFHLNRKCDGCLYQEFCLKWAAEHDDLSLLPYLADHEKNALHSAGITRVAQLAQLKDLPAGSADLVTPPAHKAKLRDLARLPRIGRRINELIHRARRYRARLDGLTALNYIPHRGYSSLPVCTAEQHPNLIRIYIDAQHDYLNDRIYLLGALVVAAEHGTLPPERRRTVLQMTDSPPEDLEQERQLLVSWIFNVLRAVAELAAPDAEGRLHAPLHLIFYNAAEQRRLLDALARHFGAVTAATPLYDLLTQIAALDSPLVSYLDQEIRTRANYPLTGQSLPAVARFLGFDWDAQLPLRTIFRTRIFDDSGRLDDDSETPQWYTRRARFASDLPLEYAYAAWGKLPPPTRGDPYADYRQATQPLLLALLQRRLEAIEHIAATFKGADAGKTAFDLSSLAMFEGKARNLADALDEFLTLERLAVLGEWRQQHLAPPEERVLAGETLLLRYRAGRLPQRFAAEIAKITAENERRLALKAELEADYLHAHPKAKSAKLTPEQKKAVKPLDVPAYHQFTISAEGLDGDLDTALALSELRRGDRMVLAPRYTVNDTLPLEQQQPQTPTAKQLLYARRADLLEFDEGSGTVTLELKNSGSGSIPGYAFATMTSMKAPLVDGELYTIDLDPNDWYGHHLKQVVRGLQGGAPNTVYERLRDGYREQVDWPAEAQAAQAQFARGLEALHEAGLLHPKDPTRPGQQSAAFDEHQRPYIAQYGDAPTLLVQGPPGTGKSYSTAFALLARLNGALAAGRSYRVFLSCKTHAATDVLLDNVRDVLNLMRTYVARAPTIATAFFHPELLRLLRAGPSALPLYRLAAKEQVGEGITPLEADDAAEQIAALRCCFVAATPGGIRKMLKATKDLYNHAFCDCLVLDEASQMNLPEAIMAGLALREDGQLIVVGDHRQMPPIIAHDWEREQRRTFQEYRTHESLFDTLRKHRQPTPPMVKFARSFRLHRELAEFLREAIYEQDDIAYYSTKDSVIAAHRHDDGFLHAALLPHQPLIVVQHSEAASQTSNAFEQQLVSALLEVLAAEQLYNLGPLEGLGVVVPHRAQRAALLDGHANLTVVDEQSGLPMRSAVDTVERFQGGERDVIIVSATESDRDYLRSAGEFLLDPRRLNVALSRAKHKMILVASETLFNLFTDDDDLFEHLMIWKNLRRRTCTNVLWSGTIDGHSVTVFGR